MFFNLACQYIHTSNSMYSVGPRRSNCAKRQYRHMVAHEGRVTTTSAHIFPPLVELPIDIAHHTLQKEPCKAVPLSIILYSISLEPTYYYNIVLR